MKRKVSIILISILAFIGLSSCSPEQQNIWNSLRPDQQQAVIGHISSTTEICNGNKNVENCNLGWQLAKAEGYTSEDFACLDYVLMRESAWYNVKNAAGGSAYGIGQALPGSKMATHGADWLTNPATQIHWVLDYVSDRYGTPCAAKKWKMQKGWY